MKNIKNIRFSNQRIKLDKLHMSIHKDNKIAKTISVTT